MPKGTFARLTSRTFLKFAKMPCAVSGRSRNAVNEEEPSRAPPTCVENMRRLKSRRGGVRSPATPPVAGDGISSSSMGGRRLHGLLGVQWLRVSLRRGLFLFNLLRGLGEGRLGLAVGLLHADVAPPLRWPPWRRAAGQPGTAACCPCSPPSGR